MDAGCDVTEVLQDGSSDLALVMMPMAPSACAESRPQKVLASFVIDSSPIRGWRGGGGRGLRTPDQAHATPAAGGMDLSWYCVLGGKGVLLASGCSDGASASSEIREDALRFV